MNGRALVSLAALLFAAVLISMAPTAQAQELPEGVSMSVLAEFPSDRPGIAKIRVFEFRMEPGTKLENVEVENMEL